jgi:hypothetical protein
VSRAEGELAEGEEGRRWVGQNVCGQKVKRAIDESERRRVGQKVVGQMYSGTKGE